MKSTQILPLAIIALVLTVFAPLGLGASISFSKIADSDTLVPNGVGMFNGVARGIVGFGTPAIDGNNIVFEAVDDTTLLDGIYLFSGGLLSKVVDENTPVPDNASSKFTGFDHNISVDGNTVAFEGYFRTIDSNIVTSREGVYTATGGVATKVADTVTTTIPGTAMVFRYVDQPGLSAGKVVFEGQDTSGVVKGFYDNIGGPLQKIADTNTTVPGQTATFSSFDPDVSLDGSIIAFEGHFFVGAVERRGVYTATGTVVTKIADTITTNIPGTATPFYLVEEPALAQGHVVFGGESDSGRVAIYTTLGGTLRLVADYNTVIPDNSMLFTAFDRNSYAIDGNNIVFEGYNGSTFAGIYIEMNGTLFTVIDTDVTLDGKDITDLDIAFDRAISGNKIVFRTTFLDNSVGIYLADVAPDGSVTITRIADTDTLVPGGTGKFYGYHIRPAGLSAPAIDGNSVAFLGMDDGFFPDEKEGIYIFDNGILSRAADETSIVPENPSANFTDFYSDLSLEGNTVAFQSIFDIGGTAYEGVYTATGGVLTKIADSVTTTVPGTGILFQWLNQPALSSGNVAFKGRDSSGTYKGIYTNIGGALQTVVDKATAVPGQPTYFSSFDPDISMNGTTVGFEAYYYVSGTKYRGAYTATGGAVTKIADTTMTIPSTATPFAWIHEPAIDGPNAVFGGQDSSGNWGIYTTLGGSLRVVADNNTPIPGTPYLFSSFDYDDYAIDANKIAIEGYGNIGRLRGIYLETDGSLVKVINTNDTLDGKAISDLDIGFDRALSGNKLAFLATFVDGSVGIYVAEISGGQTIVPDVVGSTQADANTAITAAGLTVGNVTYQYSDSIAAGLVISQNPIAGTTVLVGSGVDLVVSLGQPTVPDVINLTEADAGTAIVAAGLTVGNVTYQYSYTVVAGVVIDQNPLGGTTASIGSPVDLVISTSCADLAPDGVINQLDLKIVADNWLWVGTPGSNVADLNLDGSVDYLDFAIMASQWFASCP